MKHNKLATAIATALLLTSCSIGAELERPEDASVVRATDSSISPIFSWLTGDYRACQLDILDKTVQENQEISESNLALVEDYSVELIDGECTVKLRE